MALGTAPLAAAPAGAALQGPITVELDHAKIVRMPDNAQTIVVGNPMIADVAVQKNGVLVVTGKSYGSTNLIALDSTGGVIVETSVRVDAAADSIVTVHRGLERESYSCASVCQPSIILGDIPRYFNDTSTQATTRSSLATQK